MKQVTGITQKIAITNHNCAGEDRDNPCKDAYYRYGKNTSESRNFLASNVGIIAKQTRFNHATINESINNKLSVAVTNLLTGGSLANANIQVFN